MYQKVCTYLNKNGVNDFSKFTLRDDGQGVCIHTWNYDVAQPSSTQLASITEDEIQSVHYKAYREEMYPSVGDQLDAIWKFIEGQNPTGDSASMLASIQDVKVTYPKGS